MSDETTATKPEAEPKKKAGRPKGKAKKAKATRIKKATPGMRYDAKTKAKILDAAKGKPLAEAHVAAVGAGYRGTAASLYQMLYALGKKKSKGKRGRPAGSKNKKSAPVASKVLSNGLGAIESIVARDVQTRVNAAARAAIAELQKLIK